MVDTGAVQREGALDADAVGNAADGERLADAAVAAGNHGAFERLQTFTAAFDDLHENANGVAHAESGDVTAELFTLQRTDDFVHGDPP